MRINSTVTWTQEELEDMLKVELTDRQQKANPFHVKTRKRKDAKEKAEPQSDKSQLFHWVVRNGKVLVTAYTTPVGKKMPDFMSEQVLKQSLELLRVTMRFARGNKVTPSDLPIGVTMDTLESIVNAAAAPEEEEISPEEEEISPEEKAANMQDLKHKNRKLMKGETRERP